MKRTKRIVALTLALLLCLPLCSCKELDDMRAHQAFLQEDSTVLWDGAVYVPLPEYKEEVYGWYNRSYLAPSLWVTDAGVPVLLSERYGRRMYANQSKEIIDGWMSGGVRIAYCREDCYDRVVAELDSLADEDVFNDYNIAGLKLWVVSQSAELTTEQWEAMEEIYYTVQPTIADKNEIHKFSVNLNSLDASGRVMTSILRVRQNLDESFELYDENTNLVYAIPESSTLIDTLLIPFWDEWHGRGGNVN